MRYVFLLILLSLAAPVRADILLLVHGYLGNAGSWEVSGINSVLEANGWERGGLLSAFPGDAPAYDGPGRNAQNRVYVVDLPSEAPVVVQSDYLIGMLHSLQQMHPTEPIIIVGHSAGGVVARMALIRGGATNVKALITIASPHIGTTRANQALHATDESGPFGIVKSFFGGGLYDTVRRSRGLLHDLVKPYPGSLLYWLNAQPHPDIRYVSVVRLDPVGFAGDELVPGYSQDMNNVPVLNGKGQVILTPSGHALVTQDADTILQIINNLEPEPEPGTETIAKAS
jgi:pimeloyl-ACP methyl ester carboxylesterase